MGKLFLVGELGEKIWQYLFLKREIP